MSIVANLARTGPVLADGAWGTYLQARGLATGDPPDLWNPECFGGYVPALVRAGASFIGGCCGTSPEFISAIRGVLATLPEA